MTRLYLLLSLLAFIVMANLQPVFANACDDSFTQLSDFIKTLPASCKTDEDCELVGILSAPACSANIGLAKKWRTEENTSTKKRLQDKVLTACADKKIICDPAKPKQLCTQGKCTPSFE